MECAGRGLAFYSYQASQEVVYQEYMAKSLSDKYSTLSNQMDQIIHEANTEISSLRAKIQELKVNEEAVQKQYEKTLQAYQDKNRQHQLAKNLYDQLRSQQSHLETARAAQEHTDRMAGNGNDYRGMMGGTRPFAPSNATGGSYLPRGSLQSRQSIGSNEDLNRTGRVSGMPPHYGGQSFADHAMAHGRPSIGTPQPSRAFQVGTPVQSFPSSQQSVQMRQPLGSVDPNAHRQQTPMFDSVHRDGHKRPFPGHDAHYKPARHSHLANTMAP